MSYTHRELSNCRFAVNIITAKHPNIERNVDGAT
jgi:hypothetical protein